MEVLLAEVLYFWKYVVLRRDFDEDLGLSHIEDCEYYPGHITVVVYTRPLRNWFRREHVLRCFTCRLKIKV